MRFREHFDIEETPGGGGTPPSDDASAARVREAQSLLAAGEEAIEKALSGNSHAFLAANRQQGGE